MEAPTAPARSQQWGLTAYWFSLNMEGAALLTILIPVTLLRVSRYGHVSELARIVSLAALLTMIVPPIAGMYSDRQKKRGKRRMPLMWWGTSANIAGLLVIPHVSSVTMLTVVVMVAVLGLAASQTAYQAMMPEILPQSQWGKASGYMGLASLLGTVAGLGIAGFAPPDLSYPVLAAVVAAGVIVTAVGVREPVGSKQAGPHVQVRSHRDFVRVFWARFMVMLGQTFLMTFILYFFSEVLHVAKPGAHTALVAGEALIGAALSTVVMGRLSDHFSRRVIVFMAGLPMAGAALGFALDQSPSGIVLWALLYGVGYGAFLSVDWALGLESIPDLANVARDLGLWGIASNFPTVIAPAIGGWILVQALSPRQGYEELFITASAMFLAGSLIVLSLGKPKKQKDWSTPLAFLVYSLVTPYVRARYRVHVTGHLPRHRRSLLVAGNHGQDIEGLVVPLMIFRTRPFGRRVISAGSERLFEPGFSPTRLPAPWGEWLSSINLGSILWMLGVRPIENEPLYRPLTSWAYHVFRHYGNLPIDEVFSAEVLERAALDSRHCARRLHLRDLWSRRYVQTAVVPHGITALLEPYRNAAKTSLAAHIRQQIADLLHAVRAGDVLYLTPEGRYTANGRVGRFRQLWEDARRQIPDTVLAATAYDLLRPGPLHVWIVLDAHAPGTDGRTAVMALRPLTASHLVAHAAAGAARWSSPDNLREEAQAALAHLPPGCRIAGDLARRPEAALAQAAAYVWEWKQRHPEPDQPITDPRFPHVPDLMQYYGNQWNETMEALAQTPLQEPAVAGEPAGG